MVNHKKRIFIVVQREEIISFATRLKVRIIVRYLVKRASEV